MTCVAILHGWSDRGKSFRPLREFLGQNGFNTQEIFLADYISLDDDVRVEDVARRMEIVVEATMPKGADGKIATFDLIVHSTGALVARQWMLNLHRKGLPIPVKRFLMLAPANYGSRLAAVGKSMLGRITKGLTHGLETGEEMLRALELASPYQLELTSGDILDPTGAASPDGPFRSGAIMPFVIVGSRAYDSGPQQIVNEDGSDGTVRVAAANLNASGMTIDFTPEKPVVSTWSSRLAKPVPLAVLPERDHSEITHPEQDGQALAPYATRLRELVLQALSCEAGKSYDDLCVAWEAISDDTADLAFHPERLPQVFGDKDKHATPDHFHRYMQLNVTVKDNYGHPVHDYFLEFRQPDSGGQKSMIVFHRDVLEDVHPNSTDPAMRCLYIDHTDMLKVFYKDNDAVALSISAAPPGRNVKYFDSRYDRAHGEVTIHKSDIEAREKLETRFHRNQTHFLEIIIPRRPIDKVFALSNT